MKSRPENALHYNMYVQNSVKVDKESLFPEKLYQIEIWRKHYHDSFDHVTQYDVIFNSAVLHVAVI